MQAQQKSATISKLILTAVVFLSFGNPLFAQNLNIDGDMVTITSGGGFNEARIIAPTTGLIPTVDIPDAGVQGGAAVPNFAFTFEGDATSDGTYTFRAGIMIDDNDSDRRLEVSIPAITMTVSGGGTTLAGTVAAGSSVTVRGRAADNTTTATASLSNGLFNFNQSTLSFSAGNQVTEIISKGGILGDIANTINADGSYTYAVVLKQTGTGTAATIGTESGGFAALGCANAGTFELGSNDSSFVGGYGVQGQFRIDSAGTVLGAPTLMGASCSNSLTTPSSTPADPVCEANQTLVEENGMSTCVDDTELAQESLDEATDAVDAIGTDANADEVDDAVNSLADAADDVIGAGDPDQMISVLDTVSVGTSNVGDTSLPTEVKLENLETLIDITASIQTSLEDEGLDDDQLDSVNTQTESILSTVSTVIDEINNPEQSDTVDSLINSVEEVVNANKNLNGNSIPSEIVEIAVNVVDTTDAEIEIAPDNSEESGTYDNHADTDIGGLTPRDSLNSAGLSSGGSPPPALGNALSSQIRTDLLNAWLRAPESIFLESDSSELSLEEDESLVHIVSVRIVPSDTFQGAFLGPNGNFFLVDGNILIEMSPAAADLNSLITGVEGIGASIELLEKGGMAISDGTVTAYATFGFESLNNLGDPNPTAPTFAGPSSGDESDPNYVFTVNYANGISQDLQPMIADDAFFDSVIAFGYFVGQDRATGIISIDGVGNFRPSYVVSPIAFSDAVFFQLNADDSGVAYKVLDVNNDGVLDVQVLSSGMSQIVFGMP